MEGGSHHVQRLFDCRSPLPEEKSLTFSQEFIKYSQAVRLVALYLRFRTVAAPQSPLRLGLSCFHHGTFSRLQDFPSSVEPKANARLMITIP